jgi:CHAT domain-containing protein
MRLHKLFAVILLWTLIEASGPILSQERTDQEKRTLAVVRDWAQSANGDEWWRQNGERATKEIVDAAEAMGTEAMRHNAGNEAKALFGFAALGYLRLGDKASGLNSMLNVHQVDFMMAEKPEQYRAVRTSVLALLQMAEQSKIAPELQFRMALLTADCTFFSGRPEGDTSPDGKWLQATLTDLIPVFDKASANTSSIELERLASLASDVLGLTVDQFFENENELVPLLKKVAASLDTIFPADFVYRDTKPGDKRASLLTARIFAEVSYRYGDAAAASSRLAVAEANARATGDLEEYLALLNDRYRGDRNAKRAPAQLWQLRADARALAVDIRGKYHSRAGRIWNAYEMDRAYGEMLRDELREEAQETPEQIFAATEMLKARLLLDDMSAPPSRGAPSQTIDALEKKVLGFPPDDVTKDDLYMTETKLLSHLTSFSAFESRERADALLKIESLSANGGYTSVAPTATLAEVQRSLDRGETILEYVIPYYELHPASDLGILWITKERAQVVPMNLDKVLGPSSLTGSISIDGKARVDFSRLGEAVVEMRTAIRGSNEKEALNKLRGLYELLIRPILDKGFRPEDYSRLVIVPHGVLQYVPFAALLDETGAPLIKKTAIAMEPSASVWRKLLERAGPVRAWVAYANPNLGAGVEALDNSQKEVEAISPLMKGLGVTVQTRENATLERFSQEAPAAGILHVATHGLFPDENALDEHALLLAGGALTARAIRGLKLPQTRLAVLSVCNGGLYRMGPTDEPYGLVPAFFEAGAQNVVATLWPLDDAFGRRFMAEFYQHLLEEGAAEALRQAELHFLGEEELIRQWAGFVVAGPGRPLEVAR